MANKKKVYVRIVSMTSSWYELLEDETIDQIRARMPGYAIEPVSAKRAKPFIDRENAERDRDDDMMIRSHEFDQYGY